MEDIDIITIGEAKLKQIKPPHNTDIRKYRKYTERGEIMT